MIAKLNDAQKSVHYPKDRRMFLGIKPYMLLIVCLVVFGLIAAAWIQYLLKGLPPDPISQYKIISREDPKGFPLWISLSHWVNFFFLILIIRSGISILVDHPRLYWNNGCAPETEWIRFTPLKVPDDKVWTAKEDARYISPLIGLPGYRHTIGIARVWHFLTVPFFVLNGVIFISFLFITNQWKRLVPDSWNIIPRSWNAFVHYATFHMPYEPNGFYHYNPIQQLSYFGVVFILAPLAILTGMAMSPAIENRFHWYPKLFGNRQSARSIHFLVMLSYVVFIIIHVSLVAITGLKRNMNHITVGSDNATSTTGIYIGAGIIIATIIFCIIAHWMSWHKPRALQQAQASFNEKLWSISINRFNPKPYFQKKDISPYFWPNGKIPESEEWKSLAENNFADYKLKIGGLVDNPVELSLNDLKSLTKEQNITMHHCIQGWTGIAEWGGIPLSKIIELVKPHPSVTCVAFFSFGQGLYGGQYYDTLSMDNCLKPQSILAWEMNYEPLPLIHGAPIRLRIENQLGYKMVKWISSIQFLDTYKNLGKGFGGKNEDDEYFDLLADT